jgi:hypothetical protein
VFLVQTVATRKGNGRRATDGGAGGGADGGVWQWFRVVGESQSPPVIEKIMEMAVGMVMGNSAVR